MSEPVTVIRPSGKITIGLPSSITLITFFTAMGFVGSTARCSTWVRIILKNQLRVTPVCTTKTGSIGR